MNERDLRIDVFRAGIYCPVHVRVTHLPTGLSASATDLMQTRARDQAKAELAVLVHG